MVNQTASEKVADFLRAIEVDSVVENGRTIREYIKPKTFIPGNKVRLESTVVSVFRFSVPVEHAKKVMESLVVAGGMNVPGRGSVFSQDLVEFSKNAPALNTSALQTYAQHVPDVNFLSDLSYVICVLSAHGSGEQLSKTALELGICVPLLTFGTGNDIRDQLGLIRITISPEKEIVNLVMPQQDSGSIIRLLAEETKLDRPGRGYIYQTPVSMGYVDTRMKIGKQNYAASIDQIIAAIDTLKMGTNWRKRLDAEMQKNVNNTFLRKDSCEISIVSEEDQIDELREACIKVGATGAVTSRVSAVRTENDIDEPVSLIRSEVSVPADMAESVVDSVLAIAAVHENPAGSIQVLDAPAV